MLTAVKVINLIKSRIFKTFSLEIKTEYIVPLFKKNKYAKAPVKNNGKKYFFWNEEKVYS